MFEPIQHSVFALLLFVNLRDTFSAYGLLSVKRFVISTRRVD